MAALKVNRGLYVIVALVLAVALLVWNTSRNSKPKLIVKEAGQFMKRAPTPVTADADTTTDTFLAIQGHVANVAEKVTIGEKESRKVKAERDAVIEENRLMATRFETKMNEALEEQQEDSDKKINVIIRKIDELIMSNAESSDMALPVQGSVAQGGTMISGLRHVDDVPEGFGSSAYERGAFIPGDQLLNVFWIEPLDDSLSAGFSDPMSISPPGESTVVTSKKGVLQPLEKTNNALKRFVQGGSVGSKGAVIGDGRQYTVGKQGRGLGRRRPMRQVGDRNESQQEAWNANSTNQDQIVRSNAQQNLPSWQRNTQTRVESDGSDRHFTIPDTSLLADSVALTALVGKVYLTNKVNNPRIFKIKIGRNNVTSNGVSLPPEVEGIIMEGYAVGEYSTSCVRGTLTAATFIFHDGSVRSMYAGDAGSRPNGSGQNRIGYISDRWGNDCIPGQLISNGGKYLSQSFLLAGAAGYAEALKIAQQRTRNIISDDGTESQITTVNGDVNRYAEASALAGGVDEAVKYIRERHGTSTDLIYLPAGQRIDVHIQQELRLDIPRNARKVRYKRTSSHVKNNLD